MAKFREIVDSPPGSKFICRAMPLLLWSGSCRIPCRRRYPGTPSTEVIDKSLAYVQDRINVGWSVSEAVAVAVCLGHAIAGFDTVCTMKIQVSFRQQMQFPLLLFFQVMRSISAICSIGFRSFEYSARY